LEALVDRRIVTPVAILTALSLLAGMPCTSAAAPTASSSAGGLTRAPAPAATPVPVRTSGERRSAAVTAEFPADPHAFTRTHRGPARPVKRGLAHLLLQRPVRVTPVRPRPGARASGPPVWPGALDPAKAPKNVGAVVVAYMARNKTNTPAPTPTPVPLLRQRGIAPSGAKRVSAIDVSSQNVTGINHWWSYEEGAIPGVGRWMVNAYSGNLIVQADDMDVPHRGIDLAFRRTYNSFSRHDFAGDDGATEVGQYGSGWTNTFDAHLATNGCPNSGYSWAGFYGFSVHDIDGARYDYCFDASGRLVPPPGMQGTSLVANPDGGSFYWTKKTGTQYTFYAPYYGGTSAAYSGRIYRISGRNQNNSIQFTYAWSPDASSSANLTNIYAATDNGGSQATLSFANFNGQVLLAQLTRPDGAAITYDYDANGQLITVSKPASNNSGVPAVETYNGYQSALMVTSPRWNASAQGEGGYVAFFMDETTTAQVDGIEWAGVMNFAPNDGTSTLLQPGIATGPMLYLWETVSVQPTYTSFIDTDGHGSVQYIDAAGRPTSRQEYTGSQWLQTSEGWDANNDLTSSIDARGNQTDYTYDANGNTIAVAAPATTTSAGTFRPTKLFDYDPFNNVTAYCDETQTHTALADWSSPPTVSDALCSSHNVAHAVFQFTYPSYQPSGQLTSITTPLGYTRRLTYDASRQAGTDFGLPTTVSGDPISQLDGSLRTPAQTFWYDGNGSLRCYSKGVGTWVLSYDALARLTSVADPDDTSANGASLCGKTSGVSGSNTQTTYAYFPSGAKASAQTPPERAYGVSTTYAYDADGDVVTEATHHGCIPNQACPDGTTQKFYDGGDRLVEVQQPWDPRSFTWPGPDPIPYDGSRWMTRNIYDLTGGGTVTVGASAPFSAHGNLYKIQTYLGTGDIGAGGFTDKSGSAFDALDRETTKFAFQVGADVLQQTALQYDTGTNTLGLLAQRTNPLGQSVAFAYDARGYVTSQTYTDGGITPNETTVYDPNGRAASVTSSRFGTQQYVYDADGRLSSTTEPSGGGVTSPAQISYAFYGDGKRSAISVSSPGLTQTDAVAYSYRPDGLLQTQRLNAFSGGTWTKSYTDAGRLRAVSGADSQALTYDGTGQVQTQTAGGTAMTYTYDPEGSPITQSLPTVWWAGATSPTSLTFQRTFNVRGEFIDDLGTAPGGATTVAHRQKTDGGCMGSQTVSADGTYDPAAVPVQDYRQCVIQQIGEMSSVSYNGGSYPTGSSNRFAFDAAGRLRQTTNTSAAFIPPQSIQNGNRTSPASDVSTTITATTSYDVENHTLGRTYSATRTNYHPDQGTSETTTWTPAPLSIAWGPNGHPILVTDPAQSSTMPETLHWDGDLLLFITDATGNVVDFKVGLDGDVTPRDATMPTLTAFARDHAGTIIASTNASGTSGLTPVNPVDGNSFGYNAAPGFRASSTVVPQYVRSDGFALGGSSDGGTSVQINGVRAYDAQLQSWTTPDAYEGDIRDPASQQRYIWNRGNAIDYSDPTGYNAAVVAAGGAGAVITLDLVGDALILMGATAAGVMVKDHAAAIKHSAIELLKNAGDAENPGIGENEDAPPEGHRTGARESTREKHQEGDARRKRDHGGEKADPGRRPSRRPPPGHQGPWPPKPKPPQIKTKPQPPNGGASQPAPGTQPGS
jgi:YD repeat-containing protein